MLILTAAQNTQPDYIALAMVLVLAVSALLVANFLLKRALMREEKRLIDEGKRV